MARLELPEGDQPEIVQVWALRPEMGAAVAGLSTAVYQQSAAAGASARGRAHADRRDQRLRRLPGLADPGARRAGRRRRAVRERLVVRRPPEYSAQERLAIEYAEKFCLDHRSIDDAFFARLKEHFTDPEILDLTICIGNWVAFGRLTMLLDLDEACEVRPRATV